MSFLRISGLVVLSLTCSAAAWAQGPACGIDCRGGKFVACNDDYNENSGGSRVSCAASLGSCSGEIFCSTYGAGFPPSAYPLTLEKIYLVAASNNPMDPAQPFDLIVYQESGQRDPGPQIGNVTNLSIQGSQSAMTLIDLTQGGFTPYTINSGEFRVCLRKQFDRGHNVCLDTSGTSQGGRNWVRVRIAANPNDPCGSVILPDAWYASNGSPFPAIPGDFILRPELRPASLVGMPGYSMCMPDAGMPPVDMGTGHPDADPIDMGVVMPDTGPEDQGFPPVDMGMTPIDMGMTPVDLGVVEDMGTISHPDAQVMLGTPEITAISPKEGASDRATSVTITGKNFAPGLTVKIGAISLDKIDVKGSGTILGEVPQGIVAGTYDVVVSNPDGQAAILSGGFSITSDVAPVEKKDGCHTVPSEPVMGWLILLGLAFFRRGLRRSSKMSSLS